MGSPAPLTEKRAELLDVEVGGLVLLWQEQEQRPGRQGRLRAGAELTLRAVLQEQEKLPGRQVLKIGAE